MKLFASQFLSEKSLKALGAAGYVVTMTKDQWDLPKGDKLKQILAEFDVVVIRIYQRLTPDMLDVVKGNKVIGTLSTGLDHIDKVFFDDPRFTIINAPGANALSVAEHIFGLILNLKKRINEGNNLVLAREGHIKKLHFLGNEVEGTTLGLIGAGNITKEVARFAQVFGMNIICHTRDEHLFGYIKEYGGRFVTLDYLLKNSDIINILVPLLPATRHMIGKNQIKLMKPNATFINAARTEVVDTRALIEHADKNPNFKVGLDIDVDDYYDILTKPRNNVIVTPHIAGLTVEAKQKIEDTVVAELVALKRN